MAGEALEIVDIVIVIVFTVRCRNCRIGNRSFACMQSDGLIFFVYSIKNPNRMFLKLKLNTVAGSLAQVKWIRN